ncbi:hypothetical protein V1281_000410 [Nitrobacteraceae bacterium AZCC 2161]
MSIPSDQRNAAQRLGACYAGATALLIGEKNV